MATPGHPHPTVLHLQEPPCLGMLRIVTVDLAVLPGSCFFSSRVNVAMTQNDGTPDAKEVN